MICQACGGDAAACSHEPVFVYGQRGLPGKMQDRFAYCVNFASTGAPPHTEAIVIVWSEEPKIEENQLRALAVERMRELVERGA